MLLYLTCLSIPDKTCDADAVLRYKEGYEIEINSCTIKAKVGEIMRDEGIKELKERKGKGEGDKDK